MEISKKSWHYKLNDSMRPSFEVEVWRGKTFTTCSYIWTTFFSILLAMMFIVGGVALLLLAAMIVSGMIGVPIVLYMGLKFESWLIVNSLVAGTIGWIVAGVALMSFLVVKTTNSIAEWNTKRDKKRKASLVKQALKDRKEGICTIVTFK